MRIKMAWNLISSLPVHCNEDAFREAVNVWIQRPNVCSKIISCATLEAACKESLLKSSNQKDFIHGITGLGIAENNMSDGDHKPSFEVFNRKLFPKNPCIHSVLNEIIVKEDLCAIFIPLSEDFSVNDQEIIYKIELIPDLENLSLQNEQQIQNTSRINLHIFGDNSSSISKTCAPTRQWLSEKLLSNVVKWAGNSKKSGENLPVSLSLIPQNEYAPLYHELKEKYGKKLAAMWQEATDPQKYVFEDIAIATYLILLWKLERKLKKIGKLQSFIDIGCGNGLLVHILNSEGHPGVGVDVRRRKIWDLYPKTTILQESVVDPTANKKYEYDWLLGNHSDELTPWIPVLAARSGFQVRYWVLPCCFHDFFTKYERCQSTSSQYEDYLKFVKSIGEICGFDVGVDVLRIPSTKRICHVGMFKAQSTKEHETILQNIQQFIDDRRVSNDRFKAREKVEVVKNCTKMNHSLQNKIVNVIVAELLKTTNCIKIMPPPIIDHQTQWEIAKPGSDVVISRLDDEICESVQKSTNSTDFDERLVTDAACLSCKSCIGLSNEDLGSSASEYKRFRLWNRGGTLSLEQAAGLLEEDMRMEMKKECGGLQTLLRNHHQAFEVVCGNVSLRNWSSLNSRPRRKKIQQNRMERIVKKRPCWFFNYHPDGCPREEKHCPFLHVIAE